MTGYKYRSKPEYTKHLKELISKGFDFPNKHKIDIYIDYYDLYKDFVLLVDYDNKELVYGQEKYTTDYKIINYGKNSNIDNY